MLSRQHSFQLSQSHHTLDLALSDSLQCLTLQTNLWQSQQEPSEYSDQIIVDLLGDHQRTRTVFGSELLNRQTQIEKDKQMKEVISNYQHRVSDLRAVLFRKEDEINYVDLDLGRESLPNKEHLQLLNTITAQNNTVKRCLEQQKKLNAEIQAVEYVVGSEGKGESEGSEGVASMRPVRGSDLLVERILRYIGKEENRQKEQLQQLEQLKKQLSAESDVCKKMIAKYNQQMTAKSTEGQLSRSERQIKLDQPFLGQWLTDIPINVSVSQSETVIPKTKGKQASGVRERKKWKENLRNK